VLFATKLRNTHVLLLRRPLSDWHAWMTSTADWRPVTWPLNASRLASYLRQCHSAHHVDVDAADTGHVSRDSIV